MPMLKEKCIKFIGLSFLTGVATTSAFAGLVDCEVAGIPTGKGFDGSAESYGLLATFTCSATLLAP